MMNHSDDDDFLKAIEGAVPLKNRDLRVPIPPKRPLAPPQKSAFPTMSQQSAFDIQTGFDDNHELPFIHGAAPGVSQQLLASLARGDIPHHHQVDLHGHLRTQAKQVLRDFIKRMHQQGERCILVITGRGKNSPGGIPVLREAVLYWLGTPPICDMVLAFSTANRHDGGPGAFYVLLRKPGNPR